MSKREEDRPTKWEIRREDNACTQIWKWDTAKNKNGPISVETIWKQWILNEWQDLLDEEENRKIKKRRK